MGASAVTAVVNATVVHDSSTRTPDGVVLIEAGRVRAVGRVDVPEGAQLIDAGGRLVYPGFVDGHTHLGIHEESTEGAGADTNEASRAVSSGTRALDGVRIDDDGFRDALLGGVTTVSVKPGSGNPVGGQTLLMKTWGGRTIEEQLLSPFASVKAALGENPKSDRIDGGPVSRPGVVHAIRQALRSARTANSLDADALVAVLDGRVPLDVHAHRRDDVVAAMRIAEEFGIRLVINHGTEAGPLAELIAERGHPVVVGPLFGARLKPELGQRTWTTPARLAEAGVAVAIMTDHPETPVRTLAIQAGLAIGDGPPEVLALDAITAVPARIYGVEGRVGALRPGLDADLAVWTGDPFDPRSRVRTVLIEGRTVVRDGVVVERAP